MKLIVTIDTEADNQWDHGRPLSTKNVEYWRPFQNICEWYGILPTYLITSEIATNPQAVSFLRPLVDAEKAEVGAHLHPWTTPPFHDEPGLRFNDPLHAFPSELPSDLLRDKLETLTNQIEVAFNRRPTSFRAGRFGFDSVCAGILKQLGYIVDSSVTPLVSWKKTLGYRGGGPDFSHEIISPYWVGPDIGSQLVEMPVTILFTIALLNRFPPLQHVYHLLQKIQSNRLVCLDLLVPQPLWMRPFRRTTIKHLISGWKAAEKLGLKNVVMMFHSSELMPGASIYRPDNASVIQLMGLLEDFYKFIASENSESVTLTGASIVINPQLKDRGLSV
jgi:hypothetical protein